MALPLLMNSCAKEIPQNEPKEDGAGRIMVLKASFGEDTKVSRDYAEGKLKSEWQVGDRILCWFGDITETNAATPVEFLCSEESGEKVFKSTTAVSATVGQKVYAVTAADDEAQAHRKSQSYKNQNGKDLSANQTLTASGEVTSLTEIKLNFSYLSAFLKMNLVFPEGTEATNLSVGASSGLSEKYVLDLTSKAEVVEAAVPVTSLALAENGTLDAEKKLTVFMALPPRTITDLTVYATVGGKNYAQTVAATLNAEGGHLYAKSSLVMELAAAPEISVSGTWLSAENEVTLPFTPDTYYGVTVDYTVTNSDSAPVVSDIASDWFDAAVVGDKLRIRALKENTGSERSASFNLTVGETSKTITVKQQGLADVGTVDFGGLKWMDRVIGATLPAVQANANDVRSYGYFYQWGRNIPFPATGEVETVEGQMTPAEANASHKFIVYANGTWDWNSEGTEGGVDENGFTGKWENVGASPCPEGWRLPTYNEIAALLPPLQDCFFFAGGKQSRDEILPGGQQYKVRAYATNSTKNMGDYVLKRQGTSEAYHLRILWTNTGGTTTKDMPKWNVNGMTMYGFAGNDTQNYVTGGKNSLRISRLPVGSLTDYQNPTWGDNPGKANYFTEITDYWAANNASIEDILFPCAGRRTENGEAVETDNAAFYWSGEMFKGHNAKSMTSQYYASGLLFFRPAGRYQTYVAPQYDTAEKDAGYMNVKTEILGYRNQAMPVRCVKAE